MYYKVFSFLIINFDCVINKVDKSIFLLFYEISPLSSIDLLKHLQYDPNKFYSRIFELE